MTAPETVTRTLSEAGLAASTCTRCRLSGGRTQVVYGTGSPDADLMFIGEGPGFHEDKQGVPFVGAAGQLLNTMLAEQGMAREDVYIANVIKCLRYNALVQLGDGSWERIGRLVRSRYPGTVMSVDPKGELVTKRVTGWHASPLGDRRVFRLTYRSARRTGASRVAIQLTGDHPVLTDRGYMPVQQLPLDARIATGQGLSALAFDVVAGTVLGDGHLNAHSAHLSMSHSSKQEEYARFKASWLGELAPRVSLVSMAVGGGAAANVVSVRTRAHRAVAILRRDFYRPTKRIPEWLPRRLTPRMLAIWFMDDGYTRIRPGRQPLSEIATNGFPADDLDLAVEALGALGLPATARAGRVFFGAMATLALSGMIAPFVPPPMRYKLHPDIALAVPFDPGAFERGHPIVMYDAVRVEDITDEVRTDRTFFCIDVEDTHNFVTAGGVVHNCRPPGNRDPLPDEIESCRPWLEEQLRLIRPAVIVTLGNFATRFVLAQPVSISRVRGQRFVVDGRTVIPTFHPAAILHGGGMASKQMQSLRDDFAEIRRALDERPQPAEVQLGLF
jgi:uracil-DNA glycosylase family 4